MEHRGWGLEPNLDYRAQQQAVCKEWEKVFGADPKGQSLEPAYCSILI